MDSTAHDPQARSLLGPNLPADHGLTALGMIMQLGGHVFLAIMGFFTFTMLVVSGLSDDGSATLLLVGITGLVRSGLHRAAGAALVAAPRGTGGRNPWRLTNLYVGVALAQSVLVVAVLKTELHLEGAALAQMAMALLVWPVTLLLVTRTPRFRRFRGGIAMPEDRGFEGAGVLMLLFGIIGAIFSGIVVVTILGAGPVLEHWQGWIILLTMVLLGIRSVVHAGAGARAVGGASPGRFSEKAVSYVNWGIGSAAITGGALFLLMASGGADGSFLAFTGVMVYVLLAWPLVVKTLVITRDIPLFGDEKGEPWGRAPDLGMTALGWLLLATAVLALASTLPMLFSDGPVRGLGRGGLESFLGSGILGGDLAAKLGRSYWFSVAIAGVQLWAAIELITMSRRWKLATLIYGAVATTISLYVSLPVLEQLGDVFDHALRGGYGQIILLAQVDLALVVPIASIVLANRRGAGAPAAQARLRERS